MKEITDSFAWEELKVNSVEIKNNITKIAVRDGSGNQPPSDDKGYSAFENEITLECSNNLQNNTDKLRKHLLNIEKQQNNLKSVFRGDPFKPVVNTLDADFNTIANKKKLELSEYYNEYSTYQAEKKQFQSIHQVYREPNSADKSKTYKSALLISSLLIFEIVANSNILGAALIGGNKDGLAVSAAVAFLNVIVSCLIGYNIVKNVNHIEKPKKIFYSFLSVLYLIIISYINLGLGAYRSVAEVVAQAKKNREVLTSTEISSLFQEAVTFWNVSFSFTGIVLTFVGISFALISILDGLLYNDSYPGFGKVGRKVNRLKNNIRLSFHEYSKIVSDLFQKNNRYLQNEFKELLNKLNSWDANTNLIQKEFAVYDEKVEKLEDDTMHIILEYRKKNKRVRTTPAPSYFDEKFTITERKKQASKVFHEILHAHMEDEEREKKKIKFAEDIDLKFKAAEQNIELIQKKSEEIQSELYEKFTTN